MQPYGERSATTGTSGCSKWLLGLAIGCGVLVVLALVGGGISAWWYMRPGKQHETEAVVSPAATGSFTVSDLGADPGVTALLDRFVLEAQRQQQRDMPPWMRQVQQMSRGGGSPSMGFRMLMPKKATISLEPSAEGRDEPAVVAAVNPRGMTRLIHTLLGAGNRTAGTYRRQEVLRLGNRGWASFVGGTFLVANEEQALHGGIDRMLDGKAGPPLPPPDLGLPSRPWDVAGVVEERGEELSKVLWGDGDAPAGVRQARIGVDVASSDTTVGRVVVDCDSSEAAAAAALALDQRAAERAEKLAEEGLALRAKSRVDGTRAVLDWDLSGIDAAIAVWMAKSEASRTQPREPDGRVD